MRAGSSLLLLTLLLVLRTGTSAAGIGNRQEEEDDDGVVITEDPQAEPYIFHPKETELLEAAAKGAARLVSAGLSQATSGKQASPDLMAKLLGLLGFDSSKLGAIAVNAIIFIAQLISTTLIGPKSLESDPPSGNPTSWIFENSPLEARELVKEATERTLPEKLIEVVRDSSRISTDCVELLICKGAPLLWGMQRSLSRPPGSDWPKLTPVERMYTSFPPLEQVTDQAAVCDVRFPACKIKYANDQD